jgi:starch phosphorylase
MARLTPRFSANRAVRQYTEQYYLPAAAAYQGRAADKGAQGKRMADWRRDLEGKWAGLGLGEVKVETRDGRHLFEVPVFLNGLDPQTVRVELYADVPAGVDPLRQEMKPIPRATGAGEGAFYGTAVPAARPPSDYTVRVIPRFEGVSIPLEEAHILWKK